MDEKLPFGTDLFRSKRFEELSNGIDLEGSVGPIYGIILRIRELLFICISQRPLVSLVWYMSVRLLPIVKVCDLRGNITSPFFVWTLLRKKDPSSSIFCHTANTRCKQEMCTVYT